jgi:hypothetical protein
MTSYLILPTEQEAQDRSREGFVIDTATKRGLTREATITAIADNVTKYRWAISVGVDGQTAVVIDGDEQLLTPEEQAALVPTLPEENWPPPLPPEQPAALADKKRKR